MASTPAGVEAETTKPPRSAAAALSGWPSTAVAMRSCAAMSSGPPTSALAATTPATVAAADEPRPRASGIALCIVIRQPTPSGSWTAGLGQGRLETLHEPVVAVVGQLVAALAIDRELDLAAAPAPDLELDPVREREGDARGSRSPPRGWPRWPAPRP